MFTKVSVSTAGKKSLTRSKAELEALLRTVFPSDSVDLWLMGLDTKGVRTFTIKGTEILVRVVE